MVISARDLTIRPTQHGLLFLGILLAMLLGSINYNNNAGFILVFLLGSMGMISLVHSYKNLIGMRVRISGPSPVFAGQAGFFPVDLTLPKGSGKAVSLSFESSDEVQFSSGKDAESRVSSVSSVSSVSVPFETRARGEHSPGDLLVRSVFPFGLFRLAARISHPSVILVFPAPVRAPYDTGLAGADLDGNKESRFQGPDDFQGLTSYQPGSPKGHISWKTLSKGKGLFIKQFTAETGQDILLDLARVRGQDIEARLSILCQAVLEAGKNRVPYGLRLGPTFYAAPGTGRRHSHDCLKALALFSGDTAENP